MAVQDGDVLEQRRSRGSSSSSSYYLAKCVLKSSVVLQAVYGHIRSPSTLDLVFGKETAIELVVITEDGIVQSVCEQPVFGIIKDLKVLPWNDNYRGPQPQIHGKDLLVVLSDSGKMSFLTFNIELHRFLAVSHIILSLPGNALKDLSRFLTIESRGRAVAVAAIEDRVTVFSTSSAAGNNIVDKRMEYPREPIAALAGKEVTAALKKGTSTGWGTIWGVAFVSTSVDSNISSSEVAVTLQLAVLLHRKGMQETEVQVLMYDRQEHCIHCIARFPSGSHLAYNVIDVPAFPGFLVLFRAVDLVLLDLRNPRIPCLALVIPFSNSLKNEFPKVQGSGHEGDEEVASALLNLSRHVAECRSLMSSNEVKPKHFGGIVCTWSWEPDNSHQPNIILGMDTGEVFIAKFSKVLNSLSISLSECLYKSSACKSMVWTRGGFVAALVEMGDGQVLKVDDHRIICRSLIQNIAPVMDFALVDYYNEKQNQMFACCGLGQEGSLRVIRNGVSVEKLYSTPADYEGVTGTWTMRLHRGDIYHAFLVISFVEATRILSVGLQYADITDSVGFELAACTLACGLIDDGWVAQVCSNEVRICAPTFVDDPESKVSTLPLVSSWRPQRLNVNFGAVSFRTVVLSMSHPGLLLMLGVRETSNGLKELFEIQQCQLDTELSCISIPQKEEPIVNHMTLPSVGLVEHSSTAALPSGIGLGKVCIVGTHQPSVQLLSIVPGENFSLLAVGSICLVNDMGTIVAGCIPEDVRLVLLDRPYMLVGLRNGMLVRFEWPGSLSVSSSPFSVEIPPFTPHCIDHMASVESASICTPFGGSSQQTLAVCEGDNYGVKKRDGEESLISSPTHLHLIAVRRVGVSPVSLIPLQDSLRGDIIALSDRPWLLQAAGHSQRIAYTSISFQPSNYATPISSAECPNGILFISENRLHLVEMEHSKRLNVQRLHLGSTPRRIAYHSDTKTILVMRREFKEELCGYLSDICCVDPLSGAVLSSHTFDNRETPRSMHLWKLGKEQLLLVGTGQSTGRAMIPSGEPKSAKGRLLIFQLEPKHRSSNGGSSSKPITSEYAGWELVLKNQVSLPGLVLVVSPYLEQYILASAGNSLSCLGFTSDSLQRLKRLDTVRTRFMITSIAVHLNRIAVGDCRDGILFFSYREDLRKFEHLYCDPVQRTVADCILTDLDTALVTDRHGNFCALSCANLSEENPSPERNLLPSCWYHMGEIIIKIHKGSFAYKISKESINACSVTTTSSSSFTPTESSVVASTLLGTVVIFMTVTRDEYALLDAVQKRLAQYPLTAPLLGNNHSRFRDQGRPAGVCRALDGDMLEQFLELTSSQQQAVLAEQPGMGPEISSNVSLGQQGGLTLEKVLPLLDRVYNALT